ncbi:MAG: serine hydrolase [Pseudomonadota bacterium]
MPRFFFLSAPLLALIVLGGVIFFGDTLSTRLQRLAFANSLFSGKEQYETFSRLWTLFPVKTARQDQRFPRRPDRRRRARWQGCDHGGAAQRTEDFLAETDTAALLVIQKGKIRYEAYALTGGPQTQWPSWSVAKSFVSALIGIALDEGLIKTIEDPVTVYLPALEASGYEGVSIKDILQMSSGVRWDEDYSAFNSDINRLGRIIALGGSLDHFLTTIEPDRPAGTFNRYNSADTQVLGRLLVAVTGKSLSAYMDEKLWQPLGAHANGYWLVDDKGMEMAFAGFNATARDYARLGQLYLRGGNWNGQQLVPADWVRASVTPDAPHLLAGDNPRSNNQFGYGYQWWVLGPDAQGRRGDYMAMGVYNQFIYVNPDKDLVIVKLSANSEFGVSDDQASYRDQETIALFRAIAEAAAAEGVGGLGR